MTGGGEAGRARGRHRELAVRDFYRESGYAAWRIAYGTADVIALKADEPPVLVQVKSTKRPFERFQPRDRDALLRDAQLAGGTAVLAHWPLRGSLRLWPSSEWPTVKVAA